MVISLILLGLISLGLRLWHLPDLPYPIFDEVYFPAYAAEYLDGHPSWEGHPPLGKYFIMTALKLFGRNAIGCRVAEAFVGALIPILAAALTYQLTTRRWVSLLAGVLVGLDGLYLVESRFGLINVFLVASGVSALIFLISALRLKIDSNDFEGSGIPRQRPWLLVCCGLQLGAAFSVKWNGLGFWLTVVGLLGLSWLTVGINLIQRLRSPSSPKYTNQPRDFLGAMVLVSWWEWLLCLGVMPLVMYVAQWLPHILLNPQRTLHNGLSGLGDIWQVFLALHRHILWWHSSAQVVAADPSQVVHPYCSQWYSWPVLARPVGYYFSKAGPSFIDVHALGNPILWWCSTAAVVILTLRGLWRTVFTAFKNKFLNIFKNMGQDVGQRFNAAMTVILIGYAANYLPWVITKRCLFVYHYMAASLFSFVGLALVLQWLWDSAAATNTAILRRGLCAVIVGAITVSFVFFLPIWLGLPLSPPEFYWRMWFRPDIPTIPNFNWI